jgi:1,2-phenylacetyl-CoA epoxidase catalytic subunit
LAATTYDDERSFDADPQLVILHQHQKWFVAAPALGHEPSCSANVLDIGSPSN